MTAKEQLLQELEQTSEELIAATLVFLRSAKAQQNETVAIDSSVNTVEPTGNVGESLLEMIERITADMTPEEIAQLPKDGAEQHDHYIYGTPKRQP